MGLTLSLMTLISRLAADSAAVLSVTRARQKVMLIKHLSSGR